MEKASPTMEEHDKSSEITSDIYTVHRRGGGTADGHVPVPGDVQR